jgi:hypothetical protein
MRVADVNVEVKIVAEVDMKIGCRVRLGVEGPSKERGRQR